MGTGSCKHWPAILLFAAFVIYAPLRVAWTQDAPPKQRPGGPPPPPRGGRLIVAQRAEPKTFNPLTAVDAPSREIIALLTADLIHINRRSLQTEPALAESWTASADGRNYELKLRKGLRFSDGHPMNADDVVFTFQAYLDAASGASQRDLLIVHGKPIVARKIDDFTVRFELAGPYAAAERLFDGIAILPRHLLERAYVERRLSRMWGIDTQPDHVVGLGPFRLKSYVPGQRVVLERNPYYWKADQHGRKLPYLDGIISLYLPQENMQALRLTSGDLHVVSAVNPDSFRELNRRARSAGLQIFDLGPGLEYNFLLLNMNEPPAGAHPALRTRTGWFRNRDFRKAVSAAIDREAIVRLAHAGLAEPLWGHVTAGNRLWRNRQIPRPPRSLATARALLQNASFSWQGDRLLDSQGIPVEFSILVSANNSQRARIATLIQQDLRQLGMKVSVVTLEFRTMLDQVFNRREYDGAIMALASGDADPNSEMNVWLSEGSTHVWNLSGKPGAPWEEEIDRLMRLQMTTLEYSERRRLYDRVQQLVAENLPIVCLSAPHILTAASRRVGNFQPAILRPYALWNAESLYLHEEPGGSH